MLENIKSLGGDPRGGKVARSIGKALLALLEESRRNFSRETAGFSFFAGRKRGGLGSGNDDDDDDGDEEEEEERTGAPAERGRCEERALLGASGSVAVWPSVTTRLRRSLER